MAGLHGSSPARGRSDLPTDSQHAATAGKPAPCGRLSARAQHGRHDRRRRFPRTGRAGRSAAPRPDRRPALPRRGGQRRARRRGGARRRRAVRERRGGRRRRRRLHGRHPRARRGARGRRRARPRRRAPGQPRLRRRGALGDRGSADAVDPADRRRSPVRPGRARRAAAARLRPRPRRRLPHRPPGRARPPRGRPRVELAHAAHVRLRGDGRRLRVQARAHPLGPPARADLRRGDGLGASCWPAACATGGRSPRWASTTGRGPQARRPGATSGSWPARSASAARCCGSCGGAKDRATPRRRVVSCTTDVALLVALAGLLRLPGLGSMADDPFYDGAVRTMGASWHAFLTGAIDPAATVAVDKPPGYLWLQVAATKVVGFGSVGLHLPAAIAGCVAVAALYDALRTLFGRTAGLAGRSRSPSCRSRSSRRAATRWTASSPRSTSSRSPSWRARSGRERPWLLLARRARARR